MTQGARLSAAGKPWWQNAVMYQIYPRSWADSNGDGVGDLPGIIARLDHLAWLGVDAVWLNPITPSRNEDWGYDVTDYTGVHPELGAMSDVDELIAQARRRGLRVILDLVPNHTSDRHPWFKDAVSSRGARHRDWYVWADPKEDGSPPNNWISVFGGESAWEYHEATGQYYLHNFLRSQPDLNWWNEEVREAFDEVLRFWLDRGVAGFRIDVAHGLVKDQQLRDNVPASDEDHPQIRRLGQRQVYNLNRPEVHDVLRRWRTLCDQYAGERVLIGETFVLELDRMAAFYGNGTDELHVAFNFPFIFADFQAGLGEIVEATERVLPREAWPVWTASNHDVGRFPTRWCNGDTRKTRLALMLLLTLRGAAFLYYGDEIGMIAAPVAKEELKDPVGKRFWPEREGRDPYRTPMQWSARDGAGFTSPGVEPWLPFGDYKACNVEDQRLDPSSMLSLCRDLIRLRTRDGLIHGAYQTLARDDRLWVYRRGETTTVAFNFSEEEVVVEAATGTVSISTGRDRDGESAEEGLTLRPWEGVVLDERAPDNALR